MLATSSSDDEDYDTIKNTNTKKSIVTQQSQASNSSFLNNNNNKHATPNNSNFRKPLLNNNTNLSNGHSDDKSQRSSFSESNENINRVNQNFSRTGNRQESFKSTSSSNTVNPANSNSATNNSLNTPRVHQRQKGRPKRSGDASSVNGDQDDYNDSDTSDYNYENHYAANPHHHQHQNLQADEDTENENRETDHDQSEIQSPVVSSSAQRARKHRSKNNQESSEEQEAAAAAAAALIAQQNEALKELELHKKKLQIYVFVCRCVSYPFIAKQPTDMVRRQLKITKQQLNTIKDNFDSFLQNKMTNIEADEALSNAIRSYYEVFLKSDRIAKMVQAGGCSASDFRDVFKNNIEKRVRSLPEIDGLSKETVLSSWMTKFDLIFRYNEDQNNSNSIASRRHSRSYLFSNSSSESILSKEQLYDMFQNILGIKKFEHQLIFNAAQVIFFKFFWFSIFKQ